MTIFSGRSSVLARTLAVAAVMATAAIHGQAASLVIVPTFDSTITSLAQAATIEATIKAAIATYEADITNPITVNITFKNLTSGLGTSSFNNYVVAYPTYLNALKATKTSPSDTTALAGLPATTTNPVNATSSVLVKSALAKALGLGTTLNLAATASDGTVGINTSVMNLSRTGTQVATKYDLQTVLMHEIDEVLGLGSTMGQGLASPYSTYPSPEDLFRYDASGKRSFTTSSTAVAYFSLDGKTHLDQFNQTSGGDYGDWAMSTTVQVQDVNGTAGKTANLNVELRALDVIGYTLISSLQK
jgi:hypothetical protein